MTVAPHLNAIRISNFRSIVEPLEIPLQNKMTFLVGQNNSGKTGVLRQLGMLLNNGVVSQEDLSNLTGEQPKTDFVISAEAIKELSQSFKYMPNEILKDCATQFSVNRNFGPPVVNKLTDDLFKVLNVNYFDGTNEFQKDFGNSSSRDQNVDRLLNSLWPQLNIPKTIFIPSHRAILQSGSVIPQFGQVEFPGEKIDLNKVVDQLAIFHSPHGSPSQITQSQNRLLAISKFIAFCLEVADVRIRIPHANQTIYVSINGNEQPISNLGSGIEQLIVIGMGSFTFPNHLVLIDEPEIHFHPRTQKRMMKYLHENAEAKFVIATHSAAILDSIDADIVQIWQENQQCLGRTVQSNLDRHGAIKNLGHSPSELVLANFVIWVEGPSDRIYFNHWIQKLDASLVEGTDYAIIFYGGSVLARHDFDDGEEDLVKALSVARNFAVYMDSDKSAEIDALKPHVERVSAEVIKNDGLCWVSAGREIENYIPKSVLEQLIQFQFNPFDQFGKVVKSENFDKVKFAEQVTKFWGDEWTFDLKEKSENLVKRIRDAR